VAASQLFHRERSRLDSGSAGFTLAAASALLLFIVIASGFLPVTRSIVMPLPYRDPARIAIASHGGGLATHYGLRANEIAMWQKQSEQIEGAAAYAWTRSIARVSPNFFPLLGARDFAGRSLEDARFVDCSNCVVLSYGYWQKEMGGRAITPGTNILSEGTRYRVAGVLEKRFWFLSREIAIWRIVPPHGFDGQRTGAVVRLKPEVSTSAAEQELSSILHHASGGPGWDALVQLAPVSARVRDVFGAFGLALALAIVIAGANSRARLFQCTLRGVFFFTAKTLLLLAAVLLAGLEFTYAARITLLGGTDVLTEPLSAWLFLLSSMCVLVWSMRDQQARCRVCLRRLGLATRVGCPGCLLLDWAGTELVCVEGHGMLHVPEMASCWHEPESWTALDDSWRELFQRG
jgi:hypothetical protein